MPTPTPDRRPRNRRGEGSRLRKEIVAAASAMLDEGATEDGVTLRAVARRVGVAAPSIYSHFSDRDAILLEVVREAFDELGEHLTAAASATGSPKAELEAVCAAYLSFALERPQRYRILFGGAWDASRARSSGSVDADVVAALGSDVFGAFVSALDRCVADGSSSSTDANADAAALWAGLHGYASVRPVTKEFPWPDDVVHRIVVGLAKL
jgi:AcrR family transcriptional regulator